MKRKFQFKKLVRDRILEHMQKDGVQVEHRILKKGKFVQSLKDKLAEELQELLAAIADQEMLDELADLQELIDHLTAALEYDKKDLLQTQVKKNLKNGSFDQRIYIDNIECNEEYQWLAYYLANPKKYPEIK